jgi:23S rRNA pseudouridine2605 synthase
VTEERLQKVLAHAGISSRRSAEQMILDGRVRVNGKTVTELGTRADPERDRIEVDGRLIAQREAHVYYLVHKPRGMVTTLKDPEGRPSLAELLGGIRERVYPVGRLDFHTSGALLVTNDGALAQGLLHPSREVPKTYVAKLNTRADDRMINALRQGVTLDDGYRTRPAHVVEMRVEEDKSWLEITITEGKNRQIHRMVEAVGARVMRLSRMSFAELSAEGLRPGQLRPLTPQEVSMLRRAYLGAEEAPAPRVRAKSVSKHAKPGRKSSRRV